METKNPKSFIAVYEQGSMAKASQAPYISPQGLSKSIACRIVVYGEAGPGIVAP